jgi:acylphosphatase
MTVRRRVVVSGDVQGVFFRDTCRGEAGRLGVAGWVTNRPDGRVEAHFEGAADDVERMVSWCRTGPQYARVESVEVQDEEPTGETGFSIR